jgi:hypothetical protein
VFADIELRYVKFNKSPEALGQAPGIDSVFFNFLENATLGSIFIATF